MVEDLVTPELTVASIVEKDERFLIVEERIDNQPRFNQPAGHVESGESIIQAAVRETMEETAWQVVPLAVVGLYYWPEPPKGNAVLRCLISACPVTQEQSAQLDSDIEAVHWLSRKQIIARQHQLRSPLVLAAVDNWLTGAHYPLSIIHHITP